MNSSRLLRAGAVFHWTPTTWADAYRDFTITGTPDIRGGKAVFDGVNDYLSTTKYRSSWDITPTTFSMSFLMYIPSFQALDLNIIGNGRVDNYGWIISMISDGRIKFQTCQSGATQETRTTVGDIVAGSWYRIIYVQTAGVGVFYKNSTALVNTINNTHLAAKANGTLTVGAQYDGFRKFSGTIKDFAIFPRALSATEIANISKGDPFPWSRIVYHNYNIDGVTKTHEPFSSAQLTNIIANLKSDGASALGLTTLDIADISREYGVA